MNSIERLIRNNFKSIIFSFVYIIIATWTIFKLNPPTTCPVQKPHIINIDPPLQKQITTAGEILVQTKREPIPVATDPFPHLILQTGKRSFDNLYSDVSNRIENCKRVNDGWEHVYFDDKQVDEFFEKEFPEYNDVYKKLPIKIEQSDFFRYAAIYKYGGMYMDLDVRCNVGFEQLLNIERYQESMMEEGFFTCFTDNTSPTKCIPTNNPDDLVDFGTVNGILGFESTCYNSTYFPRRLQLTQWTFGFAPGHKLLERLLWLIRRNTDQKKIGTLEVMEMTGPAVFSDAVEDFLKERGVSLDDVVGGGLVDGIIFLPMNAFGAAGGGCRNHPKYNQKPHYLNTHYITHLFAGSWKDGEHKSSWVQV